MAEKLTNGQQAAVDSRERSLLVSAAAGSGRALALVGEAGVLVGGFMLRYLVIMAALAVVFA